MQNSQLMSPIPIEIVSFEPVTRDQLKKVHDPKYVDGVLNLKCNNGFGKKMAEVAAVLRVKGV